MTPDDLLTLKLRYADAVYLAEKYRQESAQLHEQLVRAASATALLPQSSPAPQNKRTTRRVREQRKGGAE